MRRVAGMKPLMRRIVGSSLLAALVLEVGQVPVAPAVAQEATSTPAAAVAVEDEDGAATGFASGGGATRGGRAGGRGRMLVVLRIAEELRLSDEQTVKLAGEFRRTALARRELVARRTALATQLEAQLTKQPRDDAALDALTGQIVTVEQQLAQLPEQLWKSVQPMLTTEQRARLVLLRGKMKQQIEGARRRRGAPTSADVRD